MDAHARALEEDGYTAVENALAPDELAALIVAVDAFRHRNGDGALHELGFLGADERFVALVDHGAVLPLVVATLGWNIFMYHCHLDVHPPSTEPERWRWHQDGGRQNLELESPRPRLSVKVAWFLSDVTHAEMGALTVIPGSHRQDRLERPGDGSSLPPGARPLLVSAGTAVVFDRRLWHARGENRSAETRKALFYAYTYRWIRPRDELFLDAALLERQGPIRRQLLGAGTSAIGHWIPTDADVPLRATLESL
jgi:ectoine hydroxylase-related dioxygenase (phytanoyl-CoA dioxygenase family)